MNKSLVTHYILTRFHTPVTNFQFGELEHPSLADDAWLRHRLTLFESFCLPSIQSQTRNDFQWILMFSPRSPGWLKEYLQSLPVAQAHALEVNDVMEDLPLWIMENTQSPLVLTTRLDNDDALSRNFTQRLRSEPIIDAPVVINFRTGLRLTGSGLLRAKHSSNPFASLVEESTGREIQTVLGVSHDDLPLHYPIIQAKSQPAWLQTIHDKNIGNVAAGLPTRRARYSDDFPWLPEVQTWSIADYIRVVRPHAKLMQRLRS